MTRLKIFFAVLFIAVTSCSKDKTNYDIDTDIPDKPEFSEATVLTATGYKISIETFNGSFYRGYNEVRLTVSDLKTGLKASLDELTLTPIMKGIDNVEDSCPHHLELVREGDKVYYSGYIVFTEESKEEEAVWKLHLSFKSNGELVVVDEKEIGVKKQDNKNLGMVSFIGNDDEQYYIALVSPHRPKVAENTLVAGLFKLADASQKTYVELKNYTLLLDPRMPDRSMGNHSSPNNKDLTQRKDGLYQGVVNYTMKGNWTLNFMLLNDKDEVIKGTKVPMEHTPGVVGEKSELYIDVVL